MYIHIYIYTMVFITDLSTCDLDAVDIIDGLEEVVGLVYDDNVVLELDSTRLAR